MAAYKHKETGVIKYATDGSIRDDAMRRDDAWAVATKKDVEADAKRRSEELAAQVEERTPDAADQDQA